MDEDGSSNREANLKEAVRFWRAWKTVHQMCQDRVCDTPIPFDQTLARHHATTINWMRPHPKHGPFCDRRIGMLTGDAHTGI